MAPAIQLAREGFQLTPQEAAELSDPDLARFPASSHIFQRDGRLYKAGEIFRQPLLAARSNASPPIPTISTTARWPANSLTI